MRNFLRNAVLTAGTAVALLVPAAPASALNVAVVTGTATIGCFGCGTYGPAGNSASFTVSGTILGTTAINGPGSPSFTVTEPVGAICVVSGSATGTISVAGFPPSGFNWTRTGPIALVTSDYGTAVIVFVVTSPVGNPCGGAVTATFAGALVGA